MSVSTYLLNWWRKGGVAALPVFIEESSGPDVLFDKVLTPTSSFADATTQVFGPFRGRYAFIFEVISITATMEIYRSADGSTYSVQPIAVLKDGAATPVATVSAAGIYTVTPGNGVPSVGPYLKTKQIGAGAVVYGLAFVAAI